MKKHMIALVLMGAGALAQAQIYRCGNSYSQSPCPGGQQVDAQDPRSATQAAQTREAATRDAKLATELEKARLAREAQVKQTAAPSPVSAASKPAPAQGKQKTGKDKGPKDFTAVVPGSGAKAKKRKEKKKE